MAENTMRVAVILLFDFRKHVNFDFSLFLDRFSFLKFFCLFSLSLSFSFLFLLALFLCVIFLSCPSLVWLTSVPVYVFQFLSTSSFACCFIQFFRPSVYENSYTFRNVLWECCLLIFLEFREGKRQSSLPETITR